MSETNDVEMTELNPPEKSRTYHFFSSDGVTIPITFTDVTHFMSRPGGTHRLRTADGKLHIIQGDWLHIEIDVESWTL